MPNLAQEKTRWAKEYAKKVAIFCQHNHINPAEHTIEEITLGYLAAQLKATEEASRQILAHKAGK